MADKELPAAGPAALQAAQDVPVEENEQVKALIVLLMGKDPAGGRELEELAGQVASMERRLDAALEELGAMRQKIQEVQDRSLKAVLQKNCKALEGNVDAMRQRILELKGQVIEGCRNILKDFADRSAVALDGVSRFLRLRPALEAVQAAAERTVQSSDRAAARIDAFSTEFHEAGRHLKNMGRTIQGKPTEAEAKENGRVANAFKGAFKIERAFASAIGENVELSLNTLTRLEQRAQHRPSVLAAMREQAAKAAPAKDQPEPSHDKGSR